MMDAKELAILRLAQGARRPYDAPVEWMDREWEPDLPPKVDWALAAARGILADLSDRRGIKHALHADGLDEDHETRCEIVMQIAEIIRQADRLR